MTEEAAAGLVYLFGDGRSVVVPALRVLRQTQSYVVLGWDPVPGAIGYRFSSSGSQKYSVTWNPLLIWDPAYPPCNTRFAKADWYKVEALAKVEELVYP